MGRKYESDEWYESEPVTLSVGEVNVGLVTVANAVTLDSSVADIGFATVSNIAWPDPKTYIGLVTVANAITLDAGVAGVGFATVDVVNTVTTNVAQTPQFSAKYTSGPTTDWIIKGSAGFVHSIAVGAANATGTVEISDHATDGDGNIVLTLLDNDVGPKVYPVNMAMSTGITLDVTNQTHVTVVYS